jgi:hypothetical protein
MTPTTSTVHVRTRRASLLLTALLANALFAISFDALAQNTFNSGCNVNDFVATNFGTVAAGSSSPYEVVARLYGGTPGCTYQIELTDPSFVLDFSAGSSYCGYGGLNFLNNGAVCDVAVRFAPAVGSPNGTKQSPLRIRDVTPPPSSSTLKVTFNAANPRLGAPTDLIGNVVGGAEANFSVPTLSGGLLAALAASLAGVAFWRRRRGTKT